MFEIDSSLKFDNNDFEEDNKKDKKKDLDLSFKFEKNIPSIKSKFINIKLEKINKNDHFEEISIKQGKNKNKLF